jgi:opacity protein-like surface antigen
MNKSRSLVALALLAGAYPACAAAQAPGASEDRSDLRGLSLGLSLNGSATHSDAGAFRRQSAGGLGLTLGYGATDALTLFLRGDYTYRATYLDLGARYSFGASSSALRPYVEVAATGMGSSGAGLRSTGAALTGGVGLEYFVSRNLALDVGVGYSRGRWLGPEHASAPGGGGRDFGSPRLDLGLKWRP